MVGSRPLVVQLAAGEPPVTLELTDSEVAGLVSGYQSVRRLTTDEAWSELWFELNELIQTTPPGGWIGARREFGRYRLVRRGVTQHAPDEPADGATWQSQP